jgi:N-methylhydantoinase A
VLSGPAGGVVGAAWVAGLSGHRDLLTFDMGGTSTDVAAVLGGSVQTTTESVIGGVPIKLPMVDVHSVSAGGGSVAWVDEGGALRVGPHSAGADPGPAAYGLGGGDATVTDANLLLGYLEDGALLGGPGGVTLRRDLAERAVRGLGDRLGQDPVEAALGVVQVANAEMVRALRVISVERGIDPRELVLLAFGGAGGMHACALAEELGMTRVLLPRAGGVLSALGLAISDLRRDYVRPMLGNLDEVRRIDLEAGYGQLEELAIRDLGDPGLERRADLRYRGQSFELTVPFSDLGGLEARFHVEHSQRYGYRMEDEPVELVSLRLVATLPVPKPELGAHTPAMTSSAPERRRAVRLDGDWHRVEILAGERLAAGSAIAGPVVVEYPESTVVVRPGWRGSVDQIGSLELERA